MKRHAIVDKETGKVLNVIEAEQEFFNNNPLVLDADGKAIDWDKVNVIQSEMASVGDLIVDGIVYRE